MSLMQKIRDSKIARGVVNLAKLELALTGAQIAADAIDDYVNAHHTSGYEIQLAEQERTYPIISDIANILVTDKAMAGQCQDLYSLTAPEVSERNFRSTIAQYDRVFVMYEWTGQEEVYRERGDAFWKILQERFCTQTNFIKINTDNWSNDGAEATKELGYAAFPSFVLYENGRIVGEGTTQMVRIRGAPDSQAKIDLNIREILNYTKMH